MSDKRKVGFIGLGAMGNPMAKNLLKGGVELRLYNRTLSVAHEFADSAKIESYQKVTIGETPAEACSMGGIVISILANDAAVESVVSGPHGIIQGLGKGGIHISMSTISPETSRKLSELHSAAGVTYIAAPVFGRPDAAAAKRLWIVQSGQPEAKQRIRYLLDLMGQGVFDFGEDAGAANVVKLGGNFMILAAIEAMGETLAVGEKNGLSRKHLIDFYTKTIFSCPIYQNYGRIISQRLYDPPGFQLELGIKDANLIRSTAEQVKAPMPLADLVHQRLANSIEKGRGGLDWSAFELEIAEEAGINTNQS